MEPFDELGAGRLDPDPSPPETRVERGAPGAKRTGLARLLHEGVRSLPARSGEARRAPWRLGASPRVARQHLVRGRVLAVEPGHRSPDDRFSVRRRGARSGAPVVGPHADTRTGRGRGAPRREPRVVLGAGRCRRDLRPGAPAAAPGDDAGGLPDPERARQRSAPPCRRLVPGVPQGPLRDVRAPRVRRRRAGERRIAAPAREARLNASVGNLSRSLPGASSGDTGVAALSAGRSLRGEHFLGAGDANAWRRSRPAQASGR